jgi:hypothetical protein
MGGVRCGDFRRNKFVFDVMFRADSSTQMANHADIKYNEAAESLAATQGFF